MTLTSKRLYRVYVHVDITQNWRSADLLSCDGSLWGVLAVRRAGQLQIYGTVSTLESRYVYVPSDVQISDIDNMATRAATEG